MSLILKQRFFVFTLIVGLFGFAAPAYSQTTYKVDPKASKVEWKGTKFVGSAHNGTVPVKSGEVAFEQGMPSSGQIVIDMTQIKNEDLKTPKDNQKLVGHLRSDDFFSTKVHPTSTLKLNRINAIDGKTFNVYGDLTIKGTTKPVNFIANLVEDTETKKVITADFNFDRTDFDVRFGSGRFFDNLGDKAINDSIETKVTAVLLPQKKK